MALCNDKCEEEEEEQELDPWEMPELKSTGPKWSGGSSIYMYAYMCVYVIYSCFLCTLCKFFIEKKKYFTEMNTKQRVLSVLLSITKFVALLGLLYFFVCSLDVLSSAFQLVGGK